MKRLQTLGQICYYVERCENTVMKWIDKDKFPAANVGGIWESSQKEIDQWIKEKHQHNRKHK